MNIAGLNPRVFLLLNNVYEAHGRIITFLRAFSKSPMKENLLSRVRISSLPQDVSAFLDIYRSIKNLFPLKKRGSCFMCRRKKNSSSTVKCNKCVRPVCNSIQKSEFYAFHVKQIVKRNYLTNSISPEVLYNCSVVIFCNCSSNSFSIP